MGVESNIYLQRFVPSVSAQLDRLSAVDSQITQERQGWLSSGAAEELAEFYFFEGFNIPPQEVKGPFIDNFVRVLQSAMYGNLDINKTAEVYSKKVWNQMPAKARAIHTELLRRAKEHQGNYQQAVRPLTEQKKVHGTKLYEEWKDFMTGSVHHIESFAQFLSEDNYQSDRQVQRPFLESLAQQFSSIPGNLIDNLYRSIGSGLTEKTLLDMDEALLDSFLKDLSVQKQRKKPFERLWQWLEVVSHPEQINARVVAAVIQNSGILPDDLKDPFSAFVKERLSSTLSVVSRNLSGYKPRDIKPMVKMGLDMPQPSFSNKRKGIEVKIAEPTQVFEGVDLSERKVFQVMVNGYTNPSQDQLELYINKIANGFAPHDKRMQADIAKMIEVVTKDPYGLGTKKLVYSDAFATSFDDEKKKLDLRRFRADQRPMFKLDHPSSNSIRLVYYIDKIEGVDTVVVIEILDHNEFDRKYPI